MRTPIAAFLCAILAWPTAQDPPDDGQAPRPSSVMPRTRKEFQETLAAMQGGWQLMHIDLPGAADTGRQEAAFMLVSQEFLSIEIHMGYFDEDQDLAESYFQSGTYRLGVDDRGFLSTTTLIGSVFDDRERLVFEPPGNQRFYRVETTKKTVTLHRFPDGARFAFERLATLSDYDFYGRPLPKEEQASGGNEPAPPRKR